MICTESTAGHRKNEGTIFRHFPAFSKKMRFLQNCDMKIVVVSVSWHNMLCRVKIQYGIVGQGIDTDGHDV